MWQFIFLFSINSGEKMPKGKKECELGLCHLELASGFLKKAGFDRSVK